MLIGIEAHFLILMKVRTKLNFALVTTCHSTLSRIMNIMLFLGFIFLQTSLKQSQKGGHFSSVV